MSRRMNDIVSTSPRYRNQAAQRVLTVLAAFVGHRKVYGVTELSRALGMNKNMVHRALTTLTAEGYLTRDASGERYQLGYRVLDLIGDEIDEPDVAVLCRPILEQLHALTGESVFLSIIVGHSRVNVDWIEARGRRVSNSLRGRSVPLHCTEMSRILLAYLSDGEIASYFATIGPLDRYDAVFPETANQSVDEVWADIRRIRREGFLIWQNRRQYSSAYVGFPMLDSADRPHALITIGGPMERFTRERIDSLLPQMTAILEPLRQQCRLFPAIPVLMPGEAAA
jgi:DNA-binding IclR family transcriptional regulator